MIHPRRVIQSFLFVLIFLAGVAHTAPELIQSEPMLTKAQSRAYIVQLSENPIVAYDGGIAGYSATRPTPGNTLDLAASNVTAYFDYLAQRHDDVLAAVGGGEKIYDYCYSFNGFAAQLSQDQVKALRERDDVLQVWQDELLQPQTDSTPKFLRLSGAKGPWKAGLTGEDIVVGIIDSGVWPEHPSFADIPTPEFGNEGTKIPYDAPPGQWNGTGCDFGNTGVNPLDAPFSCNNKLLGARFYANTFLAFSPLRPGEYLSARDSDGHGSHVASTAIGNAEVRAEIGGEDLGKVSGMAPRARIAAYKACWNGTNPPAGFLNGCFSSDSMAAIDQAVADGVDVINFSLGGSSTSFNGPADIAFLFAADAGVFVATSQGNRGPAPGTTGTPAGVPWITAVGAMQDNKVFGPLLDVTSSDPSITDMYEGVEAAISLSLEDSGTITAALVLAEDGNPPTNDGCTSLVNGAAMAGNIALIQRGGCAFSTKFLEAQAAGATALVVFNNNGDPITMGGDPTGISIPGLMIGQMDGEAIESSLIGGDSAIAGMGPDLVISKKDTIARFSSRGPNGGAPDIIKPDISAPGVNILAAATPTPLDSPPGELFQIISGTSMSSPHIAGIGALLTQANPGWSPARVRSALMTTARGKLKKTFGDEPADPFDVGAGKVNVRQALNPGLIYDADIFDYVRFGCGSEEQPQIFSAITCAFFGSIDSSDLNLPSIGVAELLGSQTVTRRVTVTLGSSAHDDDVEFEVRVNKPPGVDVTVVPNEIELEAGESAEYWVTFTTQADAVLDQWTFGSLTWAHRDKSKKRGKGKKSKKRKKSKHSFSVRSPIAVRPVAVAAPDEVSVLDAAAAGAIDFDVGFGFSGDLFSFAGGLEAAEVQPDAVGEGDATLHFVFVPPGTRVARFSTFDETVGDGSGSDDLDLQVQGPDTAGFPFVAFSGSFTSEEEITLTDPEPGVYAVFVIHFATVNPVTDYELNFWDVGPDLGNMIVTAPPSVTLGSTEAINVSWISLAPNMRYLGSAHLANDGGEVSRTLVNVRTSL